MEHHRKQKWAVQDLRVGHPYDAIATKNGKTLWLEAKGTETAGSTVIVTRGEVEWAREHPGECVLGVLSDIVFLPSGEVDPTSGTLRLFTWNPDHGTLTARNYDFAPGDADRLSRRSP